MAPNPTPTWNPISVGSVRIEPGKLALIAGPCSLEDPGMAEEVAREVKRIAAELKLPFVFKASYAKANRSTGESYRGPGLETGLRELARIRESAGVPVTSDVHAGKVAAGTVERSAPQAPAAMRRASTGNRPAAAQGRTRSSVAPSRPTIRASVLVPPPSIPIT